MRAQICKKRFSFQKRSHLYTLKLRKNYFSLASSAPRGLNPDKHHESWDQNLTRYIHVSRSARIIDVRLGKHDDFTFIQSSTEMDLLWRGQRRLSRPYPVLKQDSSWGDELHPIYFTGCAGLCIIYGNCLFFSIRDFPQNHRINVGQLLTVMFIYVFSFTSSHGAFHSIRRFC